MVQGNLQQLTEVFIRALNGAFKSLSLYAPTHPAVVVHLQKLEETLAKFLTENDRVTFGLLEDALILQGMPLLEKGDLFKGLKGCLRAHQLEGVTFLRGVTQEELRAFVTTLNMDPEALRSQGGVSRAFQATGVSHILLVEQKERETPAESTARPPVDRLQAGQIYSRTLQTTRKAFQEVRLGRIPALSEVQSVVEGMVDGILRAKHPIMGLTMIKSYDEYLFNHCVNVSILSLAFGESVGLDHADLRDLGLGALLHDIGKVNIPEAITSKPRDLTEEEWQLVRSHPDEGVKILGQMGVTAEIALRVTREHHVRFDRKGYPRLAAGEEPHPYSMLVTTADCYDAMTTVRAYQQAFEPSRAIARMQTLAGTVFDPKLLERFIEMLGIYPPGSLVRLDTGELALVTRPGSDDTSRPWVRILQNADGQVPQDPTEVSLLEMDPAAGGYTRSILVAVDPAAYGIDVARLLQATQE
ncbi:MAG: HD-GYP domain-containing protein [Candidatus Methylomirabilales bacterium]